MRNLWSKLVYLVIGLLSLFGLQSSQAAPTPPQTPWISEARKTTPLYLQLGVERLASMESDLKLAGHWSHYSHNSHGSHWAHYSHRAHYSHYNYYR